jgi:hypothetical protein
MPSLIQQKYRPPTPRWRMCLSSIMPKTDDLGPRTPMPSTRSAMLFGGQKPQKTKVLSCPILSRLERSGIPRRRSPRSCQNPHIGNNAGTGNLPGSQVGVPTGRGTGIPDLELHYPCTCSRVECQIWQDVPNMY